MRKPNPLPDGTAERLKELLKQAKTKSEFQRIQAVYFRAATSMTTESIAEATGWHPGTVRNVQSGFLRQGEAIFRSRHVAADIERTFLLKKRMACLPRFWPRRQQGVSLSCPG